MTTIPPPINLARERGHQIADLERRAEHGYRLACQAHEAGNAAKARAALAKVYLRCKQMSYLERRPLGDPCPLCDAAAGQARLDIGGVVWLCVDHMQGQHEYEVALMLEDHDGLHDGAAVWTGQRWSDGSVAA